MSQVSVISTSPPSKGTGHTSNVGQRKFKFLGRVEGRIEELKGEVRKMLAEVFNKFKDSEGKFQESVVTDVRGLLSLYEACHLSKVSTILAKQVSHALKQPLRKGLLRLEARLYIPLYQEEPSHDEVLLTLAKLDFNLLQEQHQKELGKITRWWKDIDVPRKFPFARDRMVELFFWTSGVYFEPEFAMAREILTKVMCLTSILDDIYDVYGTLEELTLLTKAIQKTLNSGGMLMPWMDYQSTCKRFYKELLHLYEYIGNEVATKGRSYRLAYAKEVMKKLTRAYFQEAKWFHTNYIPTLEEYIPLALITSGYGMVATTSLVGMGDVVTEHAFEWLVSGCKIMKATDTISRLMDDISSHQFEQERGHVASAVELLKKHRGISEQEAKEELQKRIVDAWKDTNEELLRPIEVPTSILTRMLNLSRVMYVLYSDGDNYTHSGTNLKDYATSLYVNPLPM
uniref:Terpene synthase n=1 Tax=Psidium guajava TaxID=120290 RepID=A0AA96C7K9_PSIGU|nr:terpene synthase [Psidium guajava]